MEMLLSSSIVSFWDTNSTDLVLNTEKQPLKGIRWWLFCIHCDTNRDQT